MTAPASTWTPIWNALTGTGLPVNSRKAAEAARAPIIPPAGTWLRIPASPAKTPQGTATPSLFRSSAYPELSVFRRGILPFLGFRFGLLVFVILFRSEPHQQYVHRRDSQEDPDQLYGGYSRPVGAEAQTHRAHLGQATRNGREYGRDGVNGGKGSGDEGGSDPGGGYDRLDQSSRHQSARAGAKLVPGHPEAHQHAQRDLQQPVGPGGSRNLR